MIRWRAKKSSGTDKYTASWTILEFDEVDTVFRIYVETMLARSEPHRRSLFATILFQFAGCRLFLLGLLLFF